MSSAGRIPQTCRWSDVTSQRQGSEHVARRVVKRCVRLDSIVTCQTRCSTSDWRTSEIRRV